MRACHRLIILCLASLVLINSCHSPEQHGHVDQAPILSREDQLPGSLGRVVRVDGILLETKGHVFISGIANIDLEPPPYPLPAKEGAHLFVEGTFNFEQIWPSPVTNSLENSVQESNSPHMRVRYFLTNYKVLMVK
jgi:hypothetical protein